MKRVCGVMLTGVNAALKQRGRKTVYLIVVEDAVIGQGTLAVMNLSGSYPAGPVSLELKAQKGGVVYPDLECEWQGPGC